MLRAALDADDPAAHRLIDSIARTVGHVVGVTALVIDPDEIVIAGEVGTLLAPAVTTLREAVARETLTADGIDLRIVTTDSEQGARGAISALRTSDDLLDFYRSPRIHHPGSLDAAGGLSVS